MSFIKKILAVVLVGVLNIPGSYAALVLDRTRIIYNEGVQSVSLGVSNKSNADPYIAQSWIEDSKGNKITTPFIVLPPLERIDASEKALLRITLIPDAMLPKDKESVFYLNVREIPPKSNKVNALQIALHSKIKLFYRPAAAMLKRGENAAAKLKIVPQGNQLSITNPTPLHITVVALATAQGKTTKPITFEPVMMAPGETISVPFSGKGAIRLVVSHMNDYGGQQQTPFNCVSEACQVDDKQRSS